MANYCIVFDEHYGKIENTFLKDEKQVLKINGGLESISFLQLLYYVLHQPFSDDTILYFLEDDYIHRPLWCEVIDEIFKVNIDYVTLYEHMYHHVCEHRFDPSVIFATKNTHWRSIPFTTNTFITKFSTLKQDYQVHLKNSMNYEFTWDEGKFKDLVSIGRKLVCPIPAYATHCEENLLSPAIDWNHIVDSTTNVILE